jgi:hypothetical protein
MAINNTPPDLALELQKIYDSEINVRIGWFWDGAIEIRLGDDMNGYLAAETVKAVADIIPWLQKAVAHFYSGSSYARSLSPELREHAKQRLFQPPKIGAQVICPHCGAPMRRLRAWTSCSSSCATTAETPWKCRGHPFSNCRWPQSDRHGY